MCSTDASYLLSVVIQLSVASSPKRRLIRFDNYGPICSPLAKGPTEETTSCCTISWKHLGDLNLPRCWHECSFLWYTFSKHQLFPDPVSMNKCHSMWLFLPFMVTVGIVCTRGSCGALLACSTAIIQHLKRICFGGIKTKHVCDRHQSPALQAAFQGVGAFVSCRDARWGQSWASVGNWGGITCGRPFSVSPARSIQGSRRGLLHFHPPAMLHWPTSF